MSLAESFFASGKPETSLGVCLLNLLFAVWQVAEALIAFFLKDLKIATASPRASLAVLLCLGKPWIAFP